MSEPVEIDITEAWASAVEAMTAAEPGRGFANLVDWLQRPDWPVSHRVGVVMNLGLRWERKGRYKALAGLGKRLMTESYDDRDLGDALRFKGAVIRAQALNRLTRFGDAWSCIAPVIAEHMSDTSPASYLPETLTAAADSLAGFGYEREAGFGRALAAEAAELPDGQGVTQSFAAGVGLLFHRLDDHDDALDVFDFALQTFGLDGSNDDVRVAISGRAQSLLKLGRFDECVDACVDGLETIADQSDGSAIALRKDLLKTQALALIESGEYSRAVVVGAAIEQLAMKEPLGPGALVEISRAFAATTRFGEALDLLDAAERVAAARPDAAQPGPGFFAMARAELLDELGDHDRAKQVLRNARSAHGSEMLEMFDAQLEAVSQLPDPERSRRTALLLFARATLGDDWREDLLNESLSQLHELFDGDNRATLTTDSATSDAYAAARERWPDHFST